MRKILLGIVAIFLLCFAVYIAIYGFNLGKIEIKSISAIKEENAKLEKKITNASKLRNTDYTQSLTSLENAYKKLMTEKDKYAQMLELGVDENGQSLNKIPKYETETLWITIGNYAKKEGVDLKIQPTLNNSISKTYDLNFTVTGGYIQIIDFLYDIERDTTLIFKIDNFKMVPGTSTDQLVATFTCKDIKINISENSNTTSNTENTDTNLEPNSNTNANENTNTTTNTNTTANTNTKSNTNSTDEND